MMVLFKSKNILDRIDMLAVELGLHVVYVPLKERKRINNKKTIH